MNANVSVVLYTSKTLSNGQHPLATPHLARQLQMQDEIIVEEYNSHWWGRTTSGQTISMDGVIHTICEN